MGWGAFSDGVVHAVFILCVYVCVCMEGGGEWTYLGTFITTSAKRLATEGWKDLCKTEEMLMLLPLVVLLVMALLKAALVATKRCLLLLILIIIYTESSTFLIVAVEVCV